MLRKFSVSNFKHFKDKFVFDLSQSKDYQFNTECVMSGLVSKSVIYGPNGCGKSNLGYALFDLKMHLDDSSPRIPISKYDNYLNADSGRELAEFRYEFQFGDHSLVYSYGKKSVNQLVHESLEIDGKKRIAIDRRQGAEAFVELAGAETLNRDMSGSDISVIKYVKNNAVLRDNEVNATLKSFFIFLEKMRHAKVSDVETDYTDSYEKGIAEIFSIDKDILSEFEGFLEKMGVKCKLELVDRDGDKKLMFVHKKRNISFFQEASVGTAALLRLFFEIYLLRLSKTDVQQEYGVEYEDIIPFIFVDEFDAFYHQRVARDIVMLLKKMRCQAVLTTHNTGIMSNELLRPDCYFIMDGRDIKPIYKFTDKELREAHNIEKMYRAGAFTNG